jgi:hypothetical protein
MVTTNKNFIQNNNNFFHGVRGVVWIDGTVAGAIQDLQATESAEEDVIYVMGSRYPQAKELKNKLVNGNIKTLLFDPTVQKLMKFTDPTAVADIEQEKQFDDADFDNVHLHESTQIGFGERTSNAGLVDVSLIPSFDINVQSKVIDSVGTALYKGFIVKGCIIKSYEVMFNKDTWWIGNVVFIADKIDRVNGGS